MSGGRAVPYTLLWGAARGLDLSARAAMYLAAGILRLSDLRHGIASAWADFGRHEAAILSGLMSWEELYGHALKPDDRIFLIGCGTGRDLIALLERGHRVSGLDPAPGVVALPREMLAREGLAADDGTAILTGP
ncbi:MAG TPA: class I SAM-dependent methyltransferase [Methylomirabilota bacterium]|nr:class I SAM-dependent methyltransferase [Methylomirabilota bacterium]